MPSRSARLWIEFGLEVRDARRARKWTIRDLAAQAAVSVGMVHRVESGEPASTETATKLATALGRRAELHLVDPRKQDKRPSLSGDPVHSAMGEFEAKHLRGLGLPVGIDEPYQHYQFAGRADLVAWRIDDAALLHIENRTRFPDFQDMAGAYNAKRAYLGPALAARLGVTRWRSETHVIAALWSTEVVGALRMRCESFMSVCPDGPEAFEGWWAGQPPPARAVTSTLIVLDPMAAGRQTQWVGLDAAVRGGRARHRGYADAAQRLARWVDDGLR